MHEPGKVLLDVATAVALGGDCLADVAVVHAQPELFGPVASDPTVSRVIGSLAADIESVLPVLRAVRAAARDRVWSRRRPLGGRAGSRDGGQVIIDIDATLVTAHSDKERAEPTHKRGFGFAPMCAFVDHGPTGPAKHPRWICGQERLGKLTPVAFETIYAAANAALEITNPQCQVGSPLVARHWECCQTRS